MSENCPTCRTFAQENNSLHAEIAGLNAEILKHTREKIALRGQLTKKRNAEDVSRHVTGVARKWRDLCSPRSSIAPTGKNVEHIRTAFLHYCKGNPWQRRKLLYDAIRGAALRPYDAGYGERTANPAKGKRRVTTEHIFASEARIEAFAGYYRMVQAKPLEWKRKAWEAASATEQLWCTIAMQEMTRTPEAWRVAAPATEPAHLFLDEGPQEQETAAPVAPQLELVVDNTEREAA